MTDREREGLLADVAWLRDACRTGVLVSWEVVVVLWAVLDQVERVLASGGQTGEREGDEL